MPQSSEMQALAERLAEWADDRANDDYWQGRVSDLRSAAHHLRAASACIKFQVGTLHDCLVMIDRCEGHGWAVRCCGEVLHKSGQWEWEPMPSHRDEEFYASARFSTYEEAEAAARKAIEVRV